MGRKHKEYTEAFDFVHLQILPCTMVFFEVLEKHVNTIVHYYLKKYENVFWEFFEVHTMVHGYGNHSA